MSEQARDFWDYLRRATPARIALGRTGDGLPTQRVLEFELAHARARDAVNTNLDPTALIAELANWRPILLRSEAPDRSLFSSVRTLAAASRQTAHICLPMTGMTPPSLSLMGFRQMLCKHRQRRYARFCWLHNISFLRLRSLRFKRALLWAMRSRGGKARRSLPCLSASAQASPPLTVWAPISLSIRNPALPKMPSAIACRISAQRDFP